MRTKLPRLTTRYEAFLRGLKERIRATQLRAVLSVNSELTVLYWSIGRDILLRQDSEGWGAKVIERMATDLTKAFPEMSGLDGQAKIGAGEQGR